MIQACLGLNKALFQGIFDYTVTPSFYWRFSFWYYPLFFTYYYFLRYGPVGQWRVTWHYHFTLSNPQNYLEILDLFSFYKKRNCQSDNELPHNMASTIFRPQSNSKQVLSLYRIVPSLHVFRKEKKKKKKLKLFWPLDTSWIREHQQINHMISPQLFSFPCN